MIFLSFQGKIYFIICLDLKNAKKLTVFFSIFVLIFVATLGHVRKYFFHTKVVEIAGKIPHEHSRISTTIFFSQIFVPRHRGFGTPYPTPSNVFIKRSM